MKPTLQFRQTQQLTLTPQLQQSIRLLQLSTVELNQEIERILMDNPLLERDDAANTEDARTVSPDAHLAAGEHPASGESRADPEPESPPERAEDQDRADADSPEDWSAEGRNAARGREEDGEDRSFLAPDTPTLRDHLAGQLAMMNLGERDRQLVGVLIDALDDDGYLVESLDDIAALLPPEAEVGADELSIALKHLHNFEPTGVGARSPGECLALQIRALRWDAVYDETVARLALAIAERHLELLASRDYVRLKAATGADDETLRDAQQLIRGLNPRPGASFARVEARYVIPDVIVRKVRNTWRASLNGEAVPRLRLNRLYADLTAGGRGDARSLNTQLQEAKWLIKNIQQRFETILRVAQAIVDRQRYFFEHGAVAMRPLVLREIATTLGLHESTISRVTNQKYMATPRGTLELKYFFGSHVLTEAGGTASSTAIRAVIKQLVAAEDARAPLSDSRISQILGKQGIVVARRTIAKYRDALQIPPVSQRKSL